MEYGLYLIKFIRADGGALKSIEIYYVVCIMKNDFVGGGCLLWNESRKKFIK